MLRHVVMWKLKDFAEGNLKEVNAKKAKEFLEGLKDYISEILAIQVAIDNSSNNSNFDIMLISDFEDRNGLNIYLNHPNHKEVGEFIGKIRTDRVCVDYEV